MPAYSTRTTRLTAVRFFCTRHGTRPVKGCYGKAPLQETRHAAGEVLLHGQRPVTVAGSSRSGDTRAAPVTSPVHGARPVNTCSKHGDPVDAPAAAGWRVGRRATFDMARPPTRALPARPFSQDYGTYRRYSDARGLEIIIRSIQLRVFYIRMRATVDMRHGERGKPKTLSGPER